MSTRQQDYADIVDAELALLPPRYEDVTRRFLAGEALTLIAQDYGIGRERVRQIAAKGIRMVRECRGHR